MSPKAKNILLFTWFLTLMCQAIKLSSANLEFRQSKNNFDDAESKIAVGCKLGVGDLDEFILSKIPTISATRAYKIMQKINATDQNIYKNSKFDNTKFFESVHGVGKKTASILVRFIDLKNSSADCKMSIVQVLERRL